MKASKANLRSGAGLQFGVVNQVEFGVVLMINNIKDDWYMVTTPAGSEGWLNRELVWPAGHKVVASSESPDAVAEPENIQPEKTMERQDDAKVEKVEVVKEQQPTPGDTSTESQNVPVIVKKQQQVAQKPVGEETVLTPANAVVEERDVPELEVQVVVSESKISEVKEKVNYISVSQNGRGANIRSEPLMAGEVLRSVPPGYPLAVVERQGDWVLVEDFRERQGWVYSSLLSELGTVVIKVGKGNLRSEPSINSEIVSKLDYATVMLIEETRGEWVKVSNPEGLFGWLHKEVIWP